MELCVVFDIDETLIHFISQENYDVWKNTTDKNKRGYNYVEEKSDREVCIFRPLIKDLFTFFMKNREKISVGLWTYGSQSYAKDISNRITKMCGLPNDFFLFIFSVEDIANHSIPKDLRYVFKKFTYCNVSNTMLVDDLYTNVMHNINIQNSIILTPFAPYGREDIRRPATFSDHTRSKKDVCFRDLINICTRILKEKNTISENEPLFSENRIQKMGLRSYHHNKIMNIGKAIFPTRPPHKRTKSRPPITKKSKSKTKKTHVNIK